MVHLSMMANPSHLEAVNTVVLGKTRAKQHYSDDLARCELGLFVCCFLGGERARAWCADGALFYFGGGARARARVGRLTPTTTKSTHARTRTNKPTQSAQHADPAARRRRV